MTETVVAAAAPFSKLRRLIRLVSFMCLRLWFELVAKMDVSGEALLGLAPVADASFPNWKSHVNITVLFLQAN